MAYRLAALALATIKRDGVSRKLVGVKIAGAPLDLNMTRWPISRNGTGGGWVTSAVFSSRLGRNIGFAMVPIALAEHGTMLSVETADGTLTATVVSKPFVDPKKACRNRSRRCAGSGEEGSIRCAWHSQHEHESSLVPLPHPALVPYRTPSTTSTRSSPPWAFSPG